MSKAKALQATLSVEEQRKVIVTFLRWNIQQTVIGIQDGSFPVQPDRVESVTTIAPQTLAQLDHAVATNDSEGALTAGLTDILRMLGPMQKASTGPQLNTFFKAHLPPHVFDAVYAAGLKDASALRFDPDFPTGPL